MFEFNAAVFIINVFVCYSLNKENYKPKSWITIKSFLYSIELQASRNGHQRFPINLILYMPLRRPGSLVGIVTDYGLEDPGSNSGGNEIFRPPRLTQTHPDPHSLL